MSTYPHHLNQNYYNSPIISNPPPTTSHHQNYNPYTYQQYYNSYGHNTTNYQNQTYPGQYHNCSGCYGYGQGQAINGGYYGVGNGGCGDCSSYGYVMNRDRLTPKFPDKLKHSFVTSGERV